MITSTQNAAVKRLDGLKSTKGRREGHSFILEGERWCIEALRAGWKPRFVIHAPELCVLPPEAQGFPLISMSPHVFAKISDVESPQGIALELPLPEMSPDSLWTKTPLRAVACWNVQDPGNVGAIARSALAFDFNAFFGIESADPYSPKCLRGSAAAFLRLPNASLSAEDFLAQAKERGVRLIASTADSGTPYTKLDWTPPFVLLIGSEGHGLPEEVVKQSAARVTIPLANEVESLNAGVAAALLMSRASEQK